MSTPRAVLHRPELHTLLPGVLAFLAVAPLAAANGGYNPPAWGWSAAALLWAAGLMLVLTDCQQPSRAELVSIGGIGLLGVWMLISAVWSHDIGSAALSAERVIVYVAGLSALALVARRGSTTAVLAGTLGALTVVVGDGLTGMLFPSTTAINGIAQTGRLAAPVGYWNGMGITAAMGLLLALGMATRSRTLLARGLAAATMPVLATGLYQTFSRGAWISLAFGLVVALAFDRQRWQLLVTGLAAAPWLALDVGVAANSSALTHLSSPIASTTTQGHRLAIVMAAGAIPLVASVLGLGVVMRRWSPSAQVTRTGHWLALGLIVIAVITPFAVYGSPAQIWHRVYNGFSSSAPGGFKPTRGHQGKSLNARLFSLSGDARLSLWKAAWHEYEAHPLVGAGSGQFAAYYLQHRTGTLRAQWAHSLYLETLADLGPVGLLLLLAGLLPALYAAWRARAHPLVPIALGVYAAFLLHTGADWDWQLTGVTMAALAVAMAIMLEARPDPSPPIDLPRVRAVAVTAIVVLTLITAYGLRVNLAISRSADASASGNWASAVSEANTATSWAPWMETSWIALGEARIGQGNFPAAVTAFKRATQDNGHDWQTWFGVARASAGKAREAALVRARQLDPNEPGIQPPPTSN